MNVQYPQTEDQSSKSIWLQENVKCTALQRSPINMAWNLIQEVQTGEWMTRQAMKVTRQATTTSITRMESRTMAILRKVDSSGNYNSIMRWILMSKKRQMEMSWMMKVEISWQKTMLHLRESMWKIPTSVFVDPITVTVMTQLLVIEPYYLEAEALAGIFHQAMAWVKRTLISMILWTTKTQCRCTCSSRAALRGSSSVRESSTWCNIHRYLGRIVPPITTWLPFIIKDLRPLLLKVEFKL